MGDRSVIARETPGDSYEVISCHWHGHPDEIGSVLAEHYKDPSKVARLIGLGDLSTLGKEIGEQHDFRFFDNPPEVCTAYGRDRGWDVTPWVAGSPEELQGMPESVGAEFLYVFRSGQWWFKATKDAGLRRLPGRGDGMAS